MYSHIPNYNNLPALKFSHEEHVIFTTIFPPREFLLSCPSQYVLMMTPHIIHIDDNKSAELSYHAEGNKLITSSVS